MKQALKHFGLRFEIGFHKSFGVYSGFDNKVKMSRQDRIWYYNYQKVVLIGKDK